VLIPLARGLILILRLPLLVLIGVGALLVFAATRIDDWLRSWRSSFVRSRSVVVPLAIGGLTVITNCGDLDRVTGLVTISHVAPSALDVETFQGLRETFPTAFFAGIGVAP
jgi:hypothetical protein